MNEFNNTNYSSQHKPRKPGVYYFHHDVRNRQNKSKTVNFYVVRVPVWGNVVTVGKCNTREEAEKMFLENSEGWVGEVPFYDEEPKSKKKKL